jgi:hypothetical protein
MKKAKKNLDDYLLEAYKKSGFSRRGFLRRLGMQITGLGAIMAVFAEKAKSCGCAGCDLTCNSGCDLSCDASFNECQEKK